MGEAIRIERGRDRATEALSAAFRTNLADVCGTFEQREAAALALGNEMVRRWIADELHAIEATFEDEIVVEQRRYRRVAEGTVRYHTLCGAVPVRRAAYRLVGVHNGPTIVPLELRAGLWENATPAPLVTTRFKRSGQRWFESGVAPCLSLRALHLSARLRPAFAHVAARRATAIRAA